MRKTDLEAFKTRLTALRARLVGDMNAMADSALNRSGKESSGDLSSVPIHMADLGSDAYDQEFTISRIENDEELRDVVEGALERIDAGTYGTCVECGAKIPKARLSAIPYTPHCIKCAEQQEG
ncbi:MAG: TraR/DksA family transcriptional regulator [Planctomycetes bacterium]|nr:TraR/DksA family transcriptional regulator [Planctomycetota bacterium]